VAALDMRRAVRGIVRAPAWLYRHHLGWLGGRRFLLLTHRGRKTGQLYETVLEAIHHDRVTRESIVLSGPGTGAHWYRNIRAAPAVRVQTGRLSYQPHQRFLTPDEARVAASRFVRAHPWDARLVPWILRRLGWLDDTAPCDPAELLGSLPMVAFRPND
jgi:deazaflavin-dependent oxidoreductase (nitroreductase family)